MPSLTRSIGAVVQPSKRESPTSCSDAVLFEEKRSAPRHQTNQPKGVVSNDKFSNVSRLGSRARLNGIIGGAVSLLARS